MGHFIQIELISGAVQKLNIITQGFMQRCPQKLVEVAVTEVCFDGSGLLRTDFTNTFKGKNLFCVAVVNTFKLFAAADGPVHGIGFNAEHLLDFFQKVKRVLRFAVHLIDKGKNGNAAHGANLEQLFCLCLNAFCRVDDHDGTVRRHQGAVGVLGKVLVSGGIQNIDAGVFIMELQHRRSNRNTALFFNFHPVGHSGACALFALNDTSLLNGAAVEQQFFRQGSFAGVGMRNNRKRAALIDFIDKIFHKAILQKDGRLPKHFGKRKCSQQILLANGTEKRLSSSAPKRAAFCMRQPTGPVLFPFLSKSQKSEASLSPALRPARPKRPYGTG